MSRLAAEASALDRAERELAKAAGYHAPKSASLKDPRVRFNWGYHDAAFDHGRHRERLLVEHGPGSERRVSRAYDPAYYEGYKRGLEAARLGESTASSQRAWTECLAAHDLSRAELRTPRG